jgi:glutamine amidotransferase/cyclase
VLATSTYGEEFVAAVMKGSAMACQFHPEKSGATGLAILRSYLEPEAAAAAAAAAATSGGGGAARSGGAARRGLAKRVIACLDVRSNDNGDLVVAKASAFGKAGAPPGD